MKSNNNQLLRRKAVRMKITVVGLGKIGLPLAVQYASKGHLVQGLDINLKTVDLVNRGLEPFPGEFGLAVSLKEQVDSGRFSATNNTATAVSSADVVVVAVPLFVDNEALPDFEAMDAATREIGQALRPGTLVAYETTLPLGTTRNRLTPMLEQDSGLKVGEDFFVVFSPERVLTGRVFSDLRKYPKLVGGIDEESEARGIRFYEAVLDFDVRPDLPRANGVWSMGNAEAAELAKLAETTYRDVNIGLANQFALHAEGIGVDIYKVIEACNSQHFSHIHQPGVSVGGHCIPVYPHLYLDGDPKASVVSAARAANKAMPRHLVNRVEDALGALNRKTVLILGLAYRAGVKEAAFSGAWDLVALIQEKGGLPVVHDPLYSDAELISFGLTPHHLGEHCDAAILHTNHEIYKSLEADDLPGAQLIADGRNWISKNLKSQIKTYVLGKG
jgi:nucleotide sugar dehydrogenase